MMGDEVQCLLGLTPGPAEHDEIIGVAHEAQTVLVEVLIQGMEGDVGEQRGNDAPLRRPRGSGLNTPFSMTPAARKRSTRLRIVPSATTRVSACRMTAWGR